MSLPKTIFLAGKKKSGKDHIADRLCAELMYRKIHIADEWLDDFLRHNHIPRDEYVHNKGKYRAAVQQAAAIARAEDPFVLLHNLDERIKAAGPKVVVTGIRHINEALYAMGRGALVVKVVASNSLRRMRFIKDNEPLESFNDEFEREIDRLPFHFTLPGDMQSDEIVPAFENNFYGYLQVSEGITTVRQRDWVASPSE